MGQKWPFCLLAPGLGALLQQATEGVGRQGSKGCGRLAEMIGGKDKYYHVIIIVIADYANINSPRFFSF